MTTQRITDFSQIEKLYNSRLKKDFAPDELKPLAAIRDSWVKNEYECYGLFDEEMIEGYAFLVRRKCDYLLDYFAIMPERRGEGSGSFLLRQLSENLKGADCVICEVEDPDTAENEEIKRQRERRLLFYLRNGYRKTEVTSVVFGVNYRILELSLTRDHTTDELRRIYTELYKSILPEAFFRAEFRIRLN